MQVKSKYKSIVITMKLRCTLGFSGLGVRGRPSGSSCSGAGTGMRPVLTGEGESDVGDGLRGGVDGGTGEADDELQTITSQI